MTRFSRLVIILMTSIFVSCGSTKNVPYYKIKLVHYEDYKQKYERLIDYLLRYDNDAAAMCNMVLRDLIAFEDDIRTEIEENNTFTPYQIDTLSAIFDNVRALRKFADCTAWCAEHPVISEKELMMVADLLQYHTTVIDSSACAKVVELQKERFLFYFLVNTTNTHRNIRYAYTDFAGEGDGGIRQLSARSASLIFRVFNDYDFDWITIRSVQCY
ncbi:MAG: hypothetical protein FWF09_04345 [Bacteroidales bacterium]|nr:hypothetical protein [Bacteroidales bacterium]